MKAQTHLSGGDWTETFTDKLQKVTIGAVKPQFRATTKLSRDVIQESPPPLHILTYIHYTIPPCLLRNRNKNTQKATEKPRKYTIIFFGDDFRIQTRTAPEIRKLLTKVRHWNKNIVMEQNSEKCTKLLLPRKTMSRNKSWMTMENQRRNKQDTLKGLYDQQRSKGKTDHTHKHHKTVKINGRISYRRDSTTYLSILKICNIRNSIRET